MRIMNRDLKAGHAEYKAVNLGTLSSTMQACVQQIVQSERRQCEGPVTHHGHRHGL
jgi:hypothetical protein